MTKVKICGITNSEDALLASEFGADMLGFNFYEKSPRYISPANALEIIKKLPKETLKCGVFVNQSSAKIFEIAKTAKLDAVQMHGEETPEFVKKIKTETKLEIIKAFRVSPEFQPENVLPFKADAILLDAFSINEHGGTGGIFDWTIAKTTGKIFPKIYLAGGLSAKNVLQAIESVAPFAVDACSCLEIEKGKKDSQKLREFLQTVKHYGI